MKKPIIKANNKSWAILVLIMFLFCVIGAFYLRGSHAATPYVSAEPEGGAITGSDLKFTDATASAGAAVKFTAAISTGDTCPAYPAFPDANCTGWRHTGVTLTPYAGPYIITTPGTVIDSKDITKAISIRASNVTIKRSRISVPGPETNRYCFNDNLINVMTASCGATTFSNVLLQDVEVDGQGWSGRGEIANGGNNGAIAVDGSGITCIRCDIHSTGLGFRTGDDGIAGGLTDSYIHDIINSNKPGAHNDGFITNGGSNITILHNNIEVNNGQTSPIALYGDYSAVTHVRVEKNLLNGGSFCVYGGSITGKAYPTGTYITFIDNHFGNKFFAKCGQYGPVAYFNPDYTGNIWSGNIWHSTGAAVPYLKGQ